MFFFLKQICPDYCNLTPSFHGSKTKTEQNQKKKKSPANHLITISITQQFSAYAHTPSLKPGPGKKSVPLPLMPPPRLDMTLCSVLAWRWRPPSETLLPGFGCPWFCARHHKANPDKYAKQQGVEQNRAKKKAETTVHNRTSSTLVMASSRGNWPHSLRVAAAKV